MASESARETKSSRELPSALEAIRMSLLLKLVVIGISMIITAYLLGGDTIGVWAALLPIWGGALMLIGGGLYAALWWTRQN